MARAIDIVPALAGAQVIRTWSGMDGQMPDHIPVMGFSSTTPHLVHAFGFSGHGFQLGPMIGLVIAELIAEGQTVSPIAPFAIQRFADRADEPESGCGGVEH
jgi:sarcosine oxidase subunit beta